MTPLLRKIIAGGDHHVTRLHDEAGAFAGWRAMAHLPRCLFEKARTKLGGARPELPWWPWPVVQRIEAELNADWRVIEFGSGSSTLWLARRAAEVISIEIDSGWVARTAGWLAQRNLHNAKVIQRGSDDYYDLSAFDDESFDLAIVDGYARYKCIHNVFPKMRPGGYIYLDNSDADKDFRLNPPGEGKIAQRMLTEYAQTHAGTELSRMRGMITGEVLCAEGMLLRLPT